MNAATNAMKNMKHSCFLFVKGAVEDGSATKELLWHIKDVYGNGIYKWAILEILKENMSAIKAETDKPYNPYDELELFYHSYDEGRFDAYNEILTILEQCL